MGDCSGLPSIPAAFCALYPLLHRADIRCARRCCFLAALSLPRSFRRRFFRAIFGGAFFRSHFFAALFLARLSEYGREPADGENMGAVHCRGEIYVENRRPVLCLFHKGKIRRRKVCRKISARGWGKMKKSTIFPLENGQKPTITHRREKNKNTIC